MDTLRGNFGSGEYDDRHDFDASDELDAAMHGEEAPRDLPPAAIGQDERRMQVRAYNHWAGLLGDHTFPSIEDLEPDALPDFGPHSVLLDFSSGIEDPIVHYLGDKLADECGAPRPIERLSDVPPRSLLSRITDHYMQIMANQAPIGFEAEFVNQRGSSILYRGILLPFSSDDDTIDFIYGVINWKEMADAATADELLLEIDQALDAEDDAPGVPTPRHHDDPIADWADSPAHEAGEYADSGDEAPELISPAPDMLSDNIADFGQDFSAEPVEEEAPVGVDLPVPDFGQYALDDPDEDEDDGEEGGAYSFASLADYIEAPAKKAVDLDADEFDPADYQVEGVELSEAEEAAVPTAYEPPFEDYAEEQTEEQAEEPVAEPAFVEEHPLEAPQALSPVAVEPDFAADTLADDADIYGCLAAARELARSASASEDRSRQALYAAVGRAYDFSLAAKEAPQAYDALIEQSGLTVQERAPMTPVVKLVFGSEYDKTRLTEYAAVLNHAHRLDLARGTLADFLAEADGGLKGVVNAERRLRREESGKVVEPENVIREALAQKLRELEAMMLEAEGPEFSLVMVRRDAQEGIQVIGELSDDIAMMERAARRLIA
ncbi:MAG: hypothetical protein AAFR64_05465 [Pseudomonadota bacterium]